MTSDEKAELLKSTISQLYTNEGRSISYISRLLEINRKTLSSKIKEWNLKDSKPTHHLTPSNQKFLNKNRNFIKSNLDNNISMTKIADGLHISRDSLYKTFIQNDEVLKKAHEDYVNRIHDNHNQNIQTLMDNSSRNYCEDLPDEYWKPILGYDGYEVSNKGRVRAYAKRYNKYYLLTTSANKVNNRLYVALQHGDSHKNLAVARLVAHAFVDGFSETNNTVNHIDGNVQNNDSSNLEWVSQSDNNRHAYQNLNRSIVNGKRYEFDKILYKNKYEFKTVAAFARFLGKSETQTRRYLDEPEKHEIKFIKNRND